MGPLLKRVGGTSEAVVVLDKPSPLRVVWLAGHEGETDFLVTYMYECMTLREDSCCAR